MDQPTQELHLGWRKGEAIPYLHGHAGGQARRDAAEPGRAALLALRVVERRARQAELDRLNELVRGCSL
jgi:hypothetical protein